MSNSPLQAIPTYSQWKALKARLLRAIDCIHCGAWEQWEKKQPITIGCRIKVWEEEVISHEDGSEEVKLRSKRIPVYLSGPGCWTCQGLMMHAESEEMARYEKAEREWHELHKPQVTSKSVHIKLDGKTYILVNDRWYDETWKGLPLCMNTALHGVHAEQCDKAIIAGLEPWMRAIGLTAPPPSLTQQSDSQTRTPSRRKAYIDVTEQVLKMPRATGRDADTTKRGDFKE
mgnify:CR=1 FL=1